VRSSWLRTVLSGAFVLFMLASAHLLMVAVNAVEARVAAPRPSAGLVARLDTDLSIPAELELAAEKAAQPADRAVLLDAAATVRAGGPFAARTLPVTPFLVQAAIALSLLGLVLLWWTSRLASDAAQTIVGVFAGNLIWTGGVEYGLTIAARALGVGKVFTVVDGQVVALYGEYVLLKHTWGPMLLVLGYVLFLESSRCPLFLWWRQHVPTMRGAIVTGRIDNYGPRSAFQYATTVWAFYLLLLWAYDESVFGVHGLFTHAVLFGALASSIFVLWRLHQQRGWGPAIRYAVGAMIVVWTPLEILGKWGALDQPWIVLQSSSVVVFFGGLALGTALLWRAAQRQRNTGAGAPPLVAG
jgi:hypothetical protein